MLSEYTHTEYMSLTIFPLIRKQNYKKEWCNQPPAEIRRTNSTGRQVITDPRKRIPNPKITLETSATEKDANNY